MVPEPKINFLAYLTLTSKPVKKSKKKLIIN